MPELSLTPVRPFDFGALLPAGVSSSDLTVWGLYLVLGFWALYTLIAMYHWLRFSNASLITFPSVGIHLAVSLALISYILSGQGLFLAPFLP